MDHHRSGIGLAGTAFRPVQPLSMTDYPSGTVLYLAPKQLAGYISGYYIVLHVEDATAQLCLAGEDEAGDVCTTEKLFRTNIYNLSFFKKLPIIVPMNTERVE